MKPSISMGFDPFRCGRLLKLFGNLFLAPLSNTATRGRATSMARSSQQRKRSLGFAGSRRSTSRKELVDISSGIARDKIVGVGVLLQPLVRDLYFEFEKTYKK